MQEKLEKIGNSNNKLGYKSKYANSIFLKK